MGVVNDIRYLINVTPIKPRIMSASPTLFFLTLYKGVTIHLPLWQYCVNIGLLKIVDSRCDAVAHFGQLVDNLLIAYY